MLIFSSQYIIIMNINLYNRSYLNAGIVQSSVYIFYISRIFEGLTRESQRDCTVPHKMIIPIIQIQTCGDSSTDITEIHKSSTQIYDISNHASVDKSLPNSCSPDLSQIKTTILRKQPTNKVGVYLYNRSYLNAGIVQSSVYIFYISRIFEGLTRWSSHYFNTVSARFTIDIGTYTYWCWPFTFTLCCIRCIL
jgi:hypothetical protein